MTYQLAPHYVAFLDNYMQCKPMVAPPHKYMQCIPRHNGASVTISQA